MFDTLTDSLSQPSADLKQILSPEQMDSAGLLNLEADGVKELHWLIMYWVVRTHGLIALEFHDFTESARVFKKLKDLCKFHIKPVH